MWKVPCCDGCGAEHISCIILKDEVWTPIAPNQDKRRSGVLCFRCMQERLGRALTLYDLRICPATESMFLGALLAAQTPDVGAAMEGYVPGIEREVRGT